VRRVDTAARSAAETVGELLARLERIETTINDLYVNRLVFSHGKVRRVLGEVRAIKEMVKAWEKG
jgi:hypothetical protein